jgi:glycosyltransferase involved in cell wall biosynthesis
VLSVLVPVMNEVASLRQLVAEVTAALDDGVAPSVPPGSWELVFVDDGSTDGTWEELRQLADEHPHVVVLRLRRNVGKSAALAAGLELTRGRIVATMDGDLQDDPAELPAMIRRLDDPADLVAGHKVERRDPLSKRLPSKLFNRVTSWVTGLDLRDHNCGLKVARREVLETVPLYGEMHRFIAAISHAQGFRVTEQGVNHRPRVHGSSKFGFERYARGGLDLLTVVTLTRYARRPAHLFGGLGLVAGVIGMTILLYLSGLWFFTDQAIGGRPLLLLGALLVVLAVQLLSLGLLAELIVTRDASRDDATRHVIERRGGGSVGPGRPRPAGETHGEGARDPGDPGGLRDNGHSAARRAHPGGVQPGSDATTSN